MLLLGRLPLIFLQDEVNDLDRWIQLRPRRRPVPRTPASSPPSAKSPRRLPSAHPLHIHCSPYLPIQFHAFHPSALCPSWQKTFCCRTFAPARPVDPAGSFTDGCSLRRKHAPTASLNGLPITPSIAAPTYWRPTPLYEKWDAGANLIRLSRQIMSLETPDVWLRNLKWSAAS